MARNQNTFLASSIRPWLENYCGYKSDNILVDLPLESEKSASLGAFSQRPFDNRSACIVVKDVTASLEQDALACRKTGAPVTLLCQGSMLYWWKQGVSSPELYEEIPVSHLEGFFKKHSGDFSPDTVYRAKTLGRFDNSYQRAFVDLGLMPAVEREMGEIIERFLLDQVCDLRNRMEWSKEISKEQGQWLLKSVFWLLGAKTLHDKKVENFIRLDFSDVNKVFDRLARHYGQSAEALLRSEKELEAIQFSANSISASSDLSLVSTEALAYVYENTLITKEIRKGLGTHSTPSYLIDYIVGRLTPRIESMPVNKRRVFEPACGHGGFLVSAVRLLTSLLPDSQSVPKERRSYLRERIHGCDIDPFALEIARLSLTLTDIPNPNGWKLKEEDSFVADHIEKQSAVSDILLANPPFENFKDSEKQYYSEKERHLNFQNKTAELLHRSINALPEGGIFGVVIPQSILHNKNAKSFREMLLKNTELEEICLFPDKVFNFADVESAILVGQKISLRSDRDRTIKYRRTNEEGIDLFKNHYRSSSESQILQTALLEQETRDLRLPELEHVWQAISPKKKLQEVVDIGKGFNFLGKENEKFPSGAIQHSMSPKKDFVKGFLNARNIETHKTPSTVYLNTSEEIISVKRRGLHNGTPQVLCNYSPARRKQWCVTGFIDHKGLIFTARLNSFRSKNPIWNNTLTWAFINSPIANAFVHTHSNKRDILSGTWKRLPIPDIKTPPVKLINAVGNYFKATNDSSQLFSLTPEEEANDKEEDLKILHWRIDAEVLKLYNLPVKLERNLLDYFSGIRRVGVPFTQDEYFPEGFNAPISLSDYLSITADWEETNTRRVELIDKKIERKLTANEQTELKHLKHLADVKSQLVMPLPTEYLAKEEADLRRRGLWKGI